jgi:hypothetical protein
VGWAGEYVHILEDALEAKAALRSEMLAKAFRMVCPEAVSLSPCAFVILGAPSGSQLDYA